MTNRKNYDDERRAHLLRGLVGAEHAHLFQTSAVFHAAVNQLAGMLPLWIDAMAEKAKVEQANLDAHTVALLRAGPGDRAVRPGTPLSDAIFGPPDDRDRR